MAPLRYTAVVSLRMPLSERSERLRFIMNRNSNLSEIASDRLLLGNRDFLRGIFIIVRPSLPRVFSEPCSHYG